MIICEQITVENKNWAATIYSINLPISILSEFTHSKQNSTEIINQNSQYKLIFFIACII